jgi:hypothetical protein
MLDALYRLLPDTTRASLWATAQTAIAPQRTNRYVLTPDGRARFGKAA